MGQVLNVASKQLFNRPDDDIHPDFDSLITYLRSRESITEEHGVVNMETFEVTDTPDRTPVFRNNVALVADADFKDVDTTVGVKLWTPEGEVNGHLNDWSFGSLCNIAGAPKGYINGLPTELACRNLNNGIRTRFQSGNGTVAPITGGQIRAFYSDKYERLPDLEVAERIADTAKRLGYEPAGKFAGVRVGMPPVRPEASGLYASDRDMFLFVANEERGFEFEGDTYYHCAIAWNSEVTFKKHGWLMCLYRGICGNHLIWDAEEVLQSESIHRGNSVHETLESFDVMMEQYDARREQVQDIAIARLTASRVLEFAETRELVAERLAEYMLKKQVEAALPFLDDERAYPKDPHSVFGVTQALTLYSQTIAHSSTRDAIDRTAGRIVKDAVGF